MQRLLCINYYDSISEGSAVLAAAHLLLLQEIAQQISQQISKTSS